MKNRLSKIIALIVILGIAGFFIGIPYLDNAKISEDINELENKSQTINVSAIVNSHDFKTLPRLVKNYLSSNIKNKSFSPKLSKISITGKTREDKNSEWIDVNSKIYYSTTEPNFVEISNAKENYFIWNKVKNTYIDGKASTVHKLFSSIQRYKFEGNKLNKSYLILYLMESVFSPTTLLPNKHINWKYLNNSTAKATVWNQNLDGNATFFFNKKRQISKIVSEERYMPGKVDYTKETFTIHFANYKDVGNYIIPTYFELQWNLAGYNFTFARYQITDISYE